MLTFDEKRDGNSKLVNSPDDTYNWTAWREPVIKISNSSAVAAGGFCQSQRNLSNSPDINVIGKLPSSTVITNYDASQEADTVRSKLNSVVKRQNEKAAGRKANQN